MTISTGLKVFIPENMGFWDKIYIGWCYHQGVLAGDCSCVQRIDFFCRWILAPESKGRGKCTIMGLSVWFEVRYGRGHGGTAGYIHWHRWSQKWQLNHKSEKWNKVTHLTTHGIDQRPQWWEVERARSKVEWSQPQKFERCKANSKSTYQIVISCSQEVWEHSGQDMWWLRICKSRMGEGVVIKRAGTKESAWETGQVLLEVLNSTARQLIWGGARATSMTRSQPSAIQGDMKSASDLWAAWSQLQVQNLIIELTKGFRLQMRVDKVLCASCSRRGNGQRQVLFRKLARLNTMVLVLSHATNVDEFSKSWDLRLADHAQPGGLKSTLSASASFLHPPPSFASSCHNVELATQVLKNQSTPHKLASCHS